MDRARASDENPQVPAEAPRVRTVAVICFVPDTGHVMPLLRLAVQVSRRSGARMVCFLSGKFEKAVGDLGFAFHRIEGVDECASAPLFISLSEKSVFYNAFSNYQDLQDHYYAPLHEAVSRALPDLVASLDDLQPSLVLADTNTFKREYLRLAARCGAPLVLNRAAGWAVAAKPRLFERVYGLSRRPAALQSMVELAGILAELGFRGWRRLRHASRRNLTARRRAALQARMSELLGPVQYPGVPLQVSSGIGRVEKRVGTGRPEAERDLEILLAPLIDVRVAPIPDVLQAWLDRQGQRQIVYVCFGTMVRPAAGLLRAILHGLLASGAAVLWAQPLEQRGWLGSEPLPDHVRFEAYAPQASLLLSGRIGCFVTHAGMGAVQEALLGGVPMFCVPFLWDQPYLASVVERAGAGLMFSRARLSQHRVTAGIRELLGDPQYRERARQVALELRAWQDAPEQTAWIDALFSAGRQAPR